MRMRTALAHREKRKRNSCDAVLAIDAPYKREPRSTGSRRNLRRFSEKASQRLGCAIPHGKAGFG
jgi:hypothetical protein